MSLDDSTVDPEMLHEEPTAATEAPETEAVAAVTESVTRWQVENNALIQPVVECDVYPIIPLLSHSYHQ